MKVWEGFGSEHSHRLVLIGRFASARDAEMAQQRFEQLREVATEEADSIDWDDANPGFSDVLYEKLKELDATDMSGSDVEGLRFLDGLDRVGDQVSLHTDDAELQGLLKLLFRYGARVEIYSAHHWSEDGQPRRNSESTNGEPESEAETSEGGAE
jgi:hypothetical protein